MKNCYFQFSEGNWKLCFQRQRGLRTDPLIRGPQPLDCGPVPWPPCQDCTLDQRQEQCCTQPWPQLGTCSPVTGLHMTNLPLPRGKLHLHGPAAEQCIPSSPWLQGKLCMHCSAGWLCIPRSFRSVHPAQPGCRLNDTHMAQPC